MRKNKLILKGILSISNELVLKSATNSEEISQKKIYILIFMIRICISTLKTESYSDSFAKKLGISFTAVATLLLNTLADSLATLRTTDLLTLSYQLYKRLTEIRFVKYDFFGQHSTFFRLVPNSLSTENGQDGRHRNASCVRRKWKRQRPLPITHSSPILIYCTRRGRLETSQFSTFTEYNDTE